MSIVYVCLCIVQTYMYTYTISHVLYLTVCKLLCDIQVESYHIDRAERIRPDNSIEHRLIDG